MRPPVLSPRARLAYATVLLAVLAVFGWYVWPTPYRYFPFATGDFHSTLREHRFSGRVEMLALEGWIPTNEGRSETNKADPVADVPASTADPFADVPFRKQANPFDSLPRRR